MTFNGIHGVLNAPGQIPWPIMVVYFLIAWSFVYLYGKRKGGLRGFKSTDFVYMGIGAAFAVVWEFFIGSFLGAFVPSGLATFISIGYLGGQLFTMLVTAALVNKAGVGMMSFVIYNVLAGLFHYGFGGQPVYFFYEAMTYGLFIDIMIVVTGGNLFVTNAAGAASIEELESTRKTEAPSMVTAGVKSAVIPVAALAALEGAILGALFALPDPLFYDGFFAPFLYGGFVDWGRILFLIGAFLPSGIVVGAFAGIAGHRIARAVGQ